MSNATPIDPIGPATAPTIVPVAAPQGQTSTASPAATPTAVVSSAPAAAQVQNIKNTATQASAAITAQNATNAAAIAANPYSKQPGESIPAYNTRIAAYNASKSPTDTSATTPEQQIADTPDTGNVWVYDSQGNKTQVPIGQIPTGYSTTNPNVGPTTSVASSVTDSVGNTYKQFTDGTYGKYNALGVYSGAVDQSDFQTAQNGASLLDSMDKVTNGTYPLTPTQQAQIDGVKSNFQDLITAQNNANANYTGGVTVAENLYGMGNSISGLGEIKGTVDAGIAKISSLDSQMGAAVAAMMDSFQKDDMTNLKDAYDEYSSAAKDKQTEIDNLQTASEKALDDARQNAIQQQTLALTKMMDDNTISYQAKQQALAQSTLDEKTKADLADEATAREEAEKGTYQVKTNPDGTQSIFNTATGNVVSTSSLPSSGNGVSSNPDKPLVSGEGENATLNSQFPVINAAFTKSAFGVPYIDMSNITDNTGKLQAAEVAKQYQAENGVPLPMVTAKNVTVLQNVDDAKSNLDQMTEIITSNGLDASNFASKPINSALNDAEGATQADSDLAGLQTYALSAISLAKTMGAQGRLNQQEITLATKSLPSANDTVATVQTKLKNLTNILGNSEKSIVGNQAFSAANPSESDTKLQNYLVNNSGGSISGTTSTDFTGLDSQFHL